tara:strand:+ start:1136 stop:1474 length:339 start_codon:yes stop_codon:yes gene_type:complete
MKLTGKCKEEFEKWYKNTNIWVNHLDTQEFLSLPQSLQYGVYVDFFDSVGIYISMMASHSHAVDSRFHGFDICVEGDGFCYDIDMGYKTRPEARTKAIEKANEIYNNNKNEG